MSAPLSMESAVGYVAAEDVYVVYREYYGDGTIYGRADLFLNDEPVRGAGKSKKELVEAGVLVSENVIGSIGGDLVGVPDSNEPAVEPEVVPEVASEVAPEVASEVAPEVAACACSCGSVCACACSCPPECACVVPAAEPVAEASSPVGASPACCSGRYTVSMVVAGFTITRELNVKINEESRQIYLSD